MSWEILPAYLVRTAGFSFAHLDPLRCVGASTAAGALDVAAAARDAAGRALDELVAGERFSDVAELDAPERRKQFSRAVKRSRRFAKIAAESVPDAELDEIARVMPRVASSVTALRDAHARWRSAQQAFVTAFEGELQRTRDALQSLYRDPRLREAVLLESPEAYERIEQLIASEGPRNARSRQRERLAALYAQRFCAKNDTNSICGPHAAAFLDASDAPPAITIERNDLRRETYVSHWAAQCLLDEAVRRAPMQATVQLHPSVHVDAHAVHWFRVTDDSATSRRRQYARTELEPEGMELVRSFARPRRLSELDENVREFVDELAGAGIVHRGPSIPSGTFRPLGEVAREVGTWEASETKAWALGQIDAFTALVHEFARGDLATRASSTRQLAERFHEATGAEATRGGGHHYADRGLLHEDACAEVKATLGRARTTLETTVPLIMAALELPIELSRARTREWIEGRFGREVWVPALEVHRAFDDENVLDTQPVGARARALATAVERVRELLDARTRDGTKISGADLRAALAGAPAAGHAGFVSIDVMLRDRSDEIVLGEVHGFLWLPTCLLDVLPAPDRERVVSIMRETLDGMARGARTVECVFPHRSATDRRIPIAALDLESVVRGGREAIELGELDLRLIDEHVEFAHRGLPVIPLAPYTTYPFIQYTSQIAPMFDDLAERYFPRSLLPDRLRTGDTPRITVDDVIIARRAWRRPASSIRAALDAKTEVELYARARALRAELGCEARVFASISGEPKPILVDFENVFLLEALANLVERRSEDAVVTISEMLPGPDELVARGPDGPRTAELRLGLYRR